MNSEDSTPGALLLFEPFLDHLRRQGFHIGVEHHLRLQRLLNRVAADCDPVELKTLLCPVFATNAEQQEFFYRTFDAYYPFFRATDPADDVQSLLVDQPSRVPTKRVVRRWPYLAAAGMAVALSVAFLTWKTQGLRKPMNQPGPPPAATAPAATQPPPSLIGAPQSPAPEQTHRVSTHVTRIPPSVSRWLASYSDNRIVLGWTALMGPLLSWLFYEVYRFRRRRLLIRKAQGKIPPYSWPIRTDLAPDIYPPYDLAVTGRLLHRRYQGEAQRLDVAATVEASIAALGFPTFRYRKDSRLPEYLFLIDRVSFRDHQARLHEHLAAALNGQGLYVSVYFYEGDPRVCWNSSGDESISLEQLQRAFPEYRLLLFGNGEQLLDAVTGRLAHWHRLLTAWPDRAVLTPEPPSGWGRREMTLATQFALVPATLDGLASLAAYFELPSTADMRDWLDEGKPYGSADSVDPLRRYLGEDTFQWLCACAVYPELQWDLTLCIGALPSLPAGLVKEENLVKLLRLNWFRTGSMPDDLRRELIGHLDPKVQREVREAIIGLLESNPPPRDTFAASARQFQIAFQRLWANPKDRKSRRDLKAALENISPDELAQDYAYLDAAESVSRSPLQLLLPSRLRKLVFPAGASWLGTRSAVRLLLLAVAILGALSLLRLGDRRVTAEINRYAAGLSNGLGLSVAEVGDRVRVSWSTNARALRSARSGRLTITDGDQSRQLSLGREDLNAGSADYPPASSSLLFELAVADEALNKTIEQAGFQLTHPPAIAKDAISKEQPGGSVRIAGRVFHPPDIAAIQQRPPGALETPDAPGGTAAIQQIAPLDRVLTAAGVLPPPSERTNSSDVYSVEGSPWVYRLALQNADTRQFVTPGTVVQEGEKYRFVLRVDKAFREAVASKYVYIWSVDANQKSTLIWPVNGSKENQFPDDSRVGLADATLTGDVQIGAPYGVERFFMLAISSGTYVQAVSMAQSMEERSRAGEAIQQATALLRRTVEGKTLDWTLEQLTFRSTPRAPAGKTYALIVGISKYAKPELSLRYAQADAQAMAQFLQSPRGGALPADQLLLLTDERATTAAIRNGFQDFLKRRAGKTDTVFIFISAHGTVDASGKNASILTYDTDPQDLKSTAFGVDELQSLFTEQLHKVGRVILFVDVGKTFPFSTIRDTTVNGSVAALGDADGDLFGLVASRPKEASIEGPQFGGGHGAFTYFILKGLQGAADANGDGVVSSAELAQYVTAQVPAATGNRQHPREFGTFDGSMKMSDVTKPGININ